MQTLVCLQAPVALETNETQQKLMETFQPCALLQFDLCKKRIKPQRLTQSFRLHF